MAVDIEKMEGNCEIDGEQPNCIRYPKLVLNLMVSKTGVL